MVVNRPSIYIYVHGADAQVLRDVHSGIEEEGVFFEIAERADTDVHRLAYDAARESMLGSGIGIVGTHVALQLRGVTYGQDVEQYEVPTAEQSRKIGANSARAIKKQAFK